MRELARRIDRFQERFGCGVSWLSLGVGLQAALATGFYPFVLVDAVKVAAAGLVLPGAWTLLEVRSEK